MNQNLLSEESKTTDDGLDFSGLFRSACSMEVTSRKLSDVFDDLHFNRIDFDSSTQEKVKTLCLSIRSQLERIETVISD